MSHGGLKLRALLRARAFQFAMMYAVMFAVSVLVLVGVLYWWTIGDLNRQIDATIEAEITGLVEQYERLGIGGLISAVAERSSRNSERDSVYLFVDANLRPLAGNLEGWPVSLTRTGRWFEFERATASGDVVPIRAMVLGVGRDMRLLVGRDVSDQVRLNRVFERSASLGIAISLLLALAGGLLMSINAQRRVATINRTARQIMGGDLSQRVPLAGTNDEYDELAISINAMLNQIDGLLDGIRHVGDSIAHDLKTPLTRLRNRLERLSVAEPDDGDGLEQCVAESDGLLATFDALLRISRIESGAFRAAFEEFDLAEMVREICDVYQPAGDEREIALQCHSQDAMRIYGDRELLAQALTNLLDNAIKYTPRGGTVEVGTHSDGKLRRLVVSDSGPGVPDEEIDNLHRRFVRLDNARSEPGNGLGLALVHAVVEQHHGNLVIRNKHPGLEVCLELPDTPICSEGSSR